MREKISFTGVLFCVLALSCLAAGHAIGGTDKERRSEPSCSEETKNELVCSEEVLAAIKREQDGLPPLPPPPPPVTEAPVTGAPVTEAPGEEGGAEGDDEEYYYDDEYYDE
jgi:hypothetical protein